MTDMTDEQIIAYVDGELGPLEARRFERAVAADAELAAAVDQHRRLRATIAGRFAGVAAEPVPDRLRRLIDSDAASADESAKILAFPARPRPPVARPGGYAALAAMLVAGLAVGQLLPRLMPGPLDQRSGRVVADGSLARALDAQLASAQVADATWRIGVSFRANDGRLCRTFDGGAGAGLGCHGADGWTLERFVAGSAEAKNDYRQAGSPSADILAAAQEMMAGAPLDATAEWRARDAGWKAVR